MPATPTSHPTARPDVLRRQALSDFLTLSALWGASFLFMRLAANEFGALPTAGLRVGIAALFLLPILLYKGHWPALRARLVPILFVGLLNSAIPFALLAWAVLSLSTGMTSILNATVPMFGALVAWVWLKDRPGASRLLGLVIGFAGVALLAWDKASFKPGGTGWAVVACLVATLFYGIGASYTKRYLTGVNPMALATGSQLGATLGLLVPTLWLWPASTPGLRAWGAVVGLAVLCTGIAYILYFRLIANAGPARALAVTFLIPVFAVLYGAIVLGEAITLWMLLCGAVIVLGTALATGMLKIGK
jgi:drug/metabolite transporter (DMT)-like permease